jgi:hypothetical protein
MTKEVARVTGTPGDCGRLGSCGLDSLPVKPATLESIAFKKPKRWSKDLFSSISTTKFWTFWKAPVPGCAGPELAGEVWFEGIPWFGMQHSNLLEPEVKLGGSEKESANY